MTEVRRRSCLTGSARPAFGEPSTPGRRRIPAVAGRYQCAYIGPDTLLHRAPRTFDTREDGEAWMTDVRREISRGEWGATKAEKPMAAVTLGDYAAAWLADRTLKPRTRDHYARLLNNQINPTFGTTPLVALTPHTVRAWHTKLGPSTPTLRAHAYALLRTILGGAVNDGEIAANPAHIRGAGNSKRVHQVKPATLGELEALTTAMPKRYQAMVLLGPRAGYGSESSPSCAATTSTSPTATYTSAVRSSESTGKPSSEPRNPTPALVMSAFRHTFYRY